MFEGELTDGRGGQVPSNVIEVSKDGMMTAEPPEPSELLKNADHKVRFCSRSISNGGKKDDLDKGICVIVLADRLGDKRDSSSSCSSPLSKKSHSDQTVCRKYHYWLGGLHLCQLRRY